jgi:hypothetical protein
VAKKIYASQDFQNANRILNLPAPGSLNEPARLADLNSAVEGLKGKATVRVSTQGNLNLAAPGATIDSAAMVAGDRFVVRFNTAQAENGLYDWNGAATPATRSADANTFTELENAVVAVREGTSAGLTYRQTAAGGVIGTNNVIWVQFGTGAGAATETSAGVAEVATQAEMDAGAVDNVFATPLKIKNSPFAKRSVPAVLGDGSATTFNITHNFGTRNVGLVVRRKVAPYDQVEPEWQATDLNTVAVQMAPAPAVAEFDAVVSLL